MGLLDDAIREHLELKRRRGANPGEVAREQREALDTPPRPGDASDSGVAQPEEGPPTDASAEAHSLSSQDDLANDVQPAQMAPAGTSGETAELDMRTVLGEEGTERTPHPRGGAGGHPGEGASAPSATPGEQDSLEWEMPGDAIENQPEASAEDVLEETPEFLRDTPEQDRLWFEQRPPRDFDFDK